MFISAISLRRLQWGRALMRAEGTSGHSWCGPLVRVLQWGRALMRAEGGRRASAGRIAVGRFNGAAR